MELRSRIQKPKCKSTELVTQKMKSLVEIDASVKFEFLSEIDYHEPVMDPQLSRQITS